MAHRDYPVGKAQQQVLDALGRTATGFSDAEQQFRNLGVVVTARREGRTSVPVVRLVGHGGGFNADGEGEEWFAPEAALRQALAQWIEK